AAHSPSFPHHAVCTQHTEHKGRPTRRLWLSCADLRERGWQDLFPPPTPTFRELGASAMISKSKTREARKRRPALRSVRRCGRSHLVVAILMSAMTVSIVESN
ncbi:unnamed protein product, partial [Ectocarpus sp. 8 AP-2014]